MRVALIVLLLLTGCATDGDGISQRQGAGMANMLRGIR